MLSSLLCCCKFNFFTLFDSNEEITGSFDRKLLEISSFAGKFTSTEISSERLLKEPHDKIKTPKDK